MKQTAGLLSTYSSDEFGVCSALYELGGMVVMHDASGCNSTYTTHDEPRWYDMDSMIYISAISEMEAIMGDDDKFLNDIIETAQELKPRFIALVGAPIPYMMGTDLPAIAMMAEEATGIPAMAFAGNGMQYYTKGLSMAMQALVDRFCQQDAISSDHTDKIKINILGATPLDFSLNGSIEAIKNWINDNGMQVNSCFCMGSSLEEISRAGEADLNLVISYGGLSAARLLGEKYHIPYIAGLPLGLKVAENLLKRIKSSDYGSTKMEAADSQAPCLIIGESISAVALAEEIEASHGIACQALCPVDTDSQLLRPGDLHLTQEDQIMEAVKGRRWVIADPMFRPILRDGQELIPWPHEAFSGRIYDPVNPNLIARPVPDHMIPK